MGHEDLLEQWYELESDTAIRVWHFNSDYRGRKDIFIPGIRDAMLSLEGCTTIGIGSRGNILKGKLEAQWNSLLTCDKNLRKLLFAECLNDTVSEYRERTDKKKLFLVLDGIDEVTDVKELFSFLPDEEHLDEGVYLMLSCRTAEELENKPEILTLIENFRFSSRLQFTRKNLVCVSSGVETVYENGDYNFAITEYIKGILAEQGKRICTDDILDMTSVDELHELLDIVDHAIVDAVAVSKYLNSLQIFEYITLRGYDTDRPKLRKRILKLMKYRVIQENEMVSAGAEHGLKYYELDYFGYQLAMEHGVNFHMGNRYMSFSKRREKGMPDDTACDVKRILVGNQIILNLLMSNTQMQRFGIMETMRATDLEQAGGSCMIRTAANVKIDNTSVLAYEVVRDTPDSYEKLMSKLERYYKLIHNETYLGSNYHGDASYPQMIICGESREHNIKIAEYLRANAMWSEENTILFTEDLLNMKRSLVSIYALADDNSQMWYALPENNGLAREAA